MKKNCWEVMDCGRQPSGRNAAKDGVCPAALPSEYDGVNGGEHAGRFCWHLAGTLCDGKSQGSFVEELMDCFRCEFCQQVSREEGVDFALTPRAARKQQAG